MIPREVAKENNILFIHINYQETTKPYMLTFGFKILCITIHTHTDKREKSLVSYPLAYYHIFLFICYP